METLVVVGPTLGERVHGRREAVVRCDLLEAGLVVLIARALGRHVDACAELLEYEATDRLNTAVEIHRAENGFDGIGQDRRLLSPTGGVLAFPEPQIETDPELEPDFSECRRRDDGGPRFGQLPLGQIRKR